MVLAILGVFLFLPNDFTQFALFAQQQDKSEVYLPSHFWLSPKR